MRILNVLRVPSLNPPVNSNGVSFSHSGITRLNAPREAYQSNTDSLGYFISMEFSNLGTISPRVLVYVLRMRCSQKRYPCVVCRDTIGSISVRPRLIVSKGDFCATSDFSALHETDC